MDNTATLNNVKCARRILYKWSRFKEHNNMFLSRHQLRSFIKSKPDAEKILLFIINNKGEYTRKVLKWILKRKLS